jgi:hypothetical protein
MQSQVTVSLGVVAFVVSLAACDGPPPTEEPRASFNSRALELESDPTKDTPLAGTLQPLPSEPRDAFISRAHLRIGAYEQFLRVLEHGASTPEQRQAVIGAKRELEESKRQFDAFLREPNSNWEAPAGAVTRSVTRLDGAFARAWREGGNR